MRKPKLESLSLSSLFKKHRSFQLLFCIALTYALFLLFCAFPFLSTTTATPSSSSAATSAALRSQEYTDEKFSPVRPSRLIKSSISSASSSSTPPPSKSLKLPPFISALKFNDFGPQHNLSQLHESAKAAFNLARILLQDLTNSSSPLFNSKKKKSANEEETTKCPDSIMVTGAEFKEQGKVILIPCGLTLGSHITLVARPDKAHADYDPKIAMREGDEPVMVSQFMLELQGLKEVDGEDPPRILHFNPRLKGDWSGYPVIEQNTCYRMQWGTALRCEGWTSRDDEETGIVSERCMLSFLLFIRFSLVGTSSRCFQCFQVGVY